MCGYMETPTHSLRFKNSIQISGNSTCQSPLTFVVPVFQGVDVCGYMETQTHSLEKRQNRPLGIRLSGVPPLMRVTTPKT